VTSQRSVRLVAASLVLGLAAALLAAVSSSPAVAGRGHHHGHHGKKGKVVWDSTSFYSGFGAVAAHGKVPGGKRKVKLQVKLPGSWHTFAATKSNKRGKFAISGKLDWYGTHKVRVSTSGRHRFNRSTTANVYAAYVPRGNPADHVFIKSNGYRYSFNPCKTVRYVVNADDVGPTGLLFAQLAMAQASAATGISVKFVGTSHQIPFQTDRTRLPANQDLLVSFADEAELPDFVTRNALGIGGPLGGRAARDGKGHPLWESSQAAVVFNTTSWYTDELGWSFQGTKPVWGEVMLHELGHAFGLDHSNGADEIMYWQSGNGVYPDGYFRGIYAAGDLTGLNASGLAQGCLRKVNRFREGMPSRVAAPEPRS
jgi:hypothetical protein